MSGTICDNRKAGHDYFIEERLEAGLVLEGWEIKAIRAGRAQIAEAHVIERDGELFCINAHIAPLPQASSHEPAEPTRTRKILASRKEIDRFCSKRQVAGYTIVPMNLHWSKGRVKIELGLAKGKRQHDKRDALKDRDGAREIERAMKGGARSGGG
jgi:SsrA-binding protein